MNKQTQYYAFITAVRQVEKFQGVVLSDVTCDRENCGVESSDEFWVAMLSSATNAFGIRCEEEGINPNEQGFGVIY
jgi:hypothetical protein